MTTTITIDRAGRIVIPKSLRDRLHLQAGDQLKLESSGSEMVLKPIRSVAPLKKENGIWVFRTGVPIRDLSITDWIDRDRENRDRQIS